MENYIEIVEIWLNIKKLDTHIKSNIQIIYQCHAGEK